MNFQCNESMNGAVKGLIIILTPFISQSEEFSSDEEVVEEKPVIKRVEEEKMIRRPKSKKKRSEKLVQERVISVSFSLVCY